MLTYTRLKQLLKYDTETGLFTWLVRRGGAVRPGDTAGCIRSNGYWYISVDNEQFIAHRLAWLYMTGKWPDDEIDHRDRVRSNNVWSNLREANTSQQQQNRTPKHGVSGFVGVDRNHGKWRAQITVAGRKTHLGLFDDIEQAKAARLAAERELFTHSTRVG
jgi:HNH endonuclease